jgi:hypothetical protein
MPTLFQSPNKLAAPVNAPLLAFKLLTMPKSCTAQSLSHKPVWLFDVDGTLTPPGGQICPAFALWFLRFMSQRDVRIVSGGTFERVHKQLGADIMDRLKRAYCCLGSSTWEHGTEIARSSVAIDPAVVDYAQTLIGTTRFGTTKYPTLVRKSGMLTLVPAGAGAPDKVLHQYAIWDEQFQERKLFAANIRDKFPELRVLVSGRASLDIFAPGQDKSQVLSDVLGPAIFFGDAMGAGGNDAALSAALMTRFDGSRAIPVFDWQQTWKTLSILEPQTFLERERAYGQAVELESLLAYA